MAFRPISPRSRNGLITLLMVVAVCSSCLSTPTIEGVDAGNASSDRIAASEQDVASDAEVDWTNFGLGAATGDTGEPAADAAQSVPAELDADGFAVTAFVLVETPSGAVCSSGYNVLVYNQVVDAIAASNQNALTETAVSLLQGHVAALGSEGAEFAAVVAALNGHSLDAGGWGQLRVSEGFTDIAAGAAYDRHLDQLRSVVRNCESFSDDRFIDDVFWAVDDLAPVGTLDSSSNFDLTTFSHSQLVISFPSAWANHSSSRGSLVDFVVSPSLAPYRADVATTYVRVRVLDDIGAAEFIDVAEQVGAGCEETSRQADVQVPERPQYLATNVDYSCPGDLSVVTHYASTLDSGVILEAAHDGTDAGFQAVADIVSSLRLQA